MAIGRAFFAVLAVAVISSVCDAQRFRSFEADPSTPLRRLARADYEDGVSEPRLTFAKTNTSLPGARIVSNELVNQDTSVPEPTGLNSLFWSWGQFIDHDMVLVRDREEDEFNIELPEDSDQFGSMTELPFSRSDFVVRRGRRQPREQKNTITPLIDASQVYGSTEDVAKSLRELGGDSPFLEEGPGGFPKFDGRRFIAGDIRVSEQPGLTALHGLFVKEHNRLVRFLMDEIAITDNTTLYETARLLVGAEIQAITAKEFLPKIVGRATGRKGRFSARPWARNLVFNEFATACYRFGHTMVPETMKSANSDYCDIQAQEMSLRDSFFNPTLSMDTGLDNILRGLMINPAEAADIKLVDSLRNFLFVGQSGAPFGLDLASFNIQRGRDHGLANYCKVRQGLRLSSGGLTYSSITGGNAPLSEALESLYGPDPCEMDLWVAGLVEKKSRGSILGQTCSAVIMRQFDNSFRADPFYLDNIDWTEYGLERDPPLTKSPTVRLGSVGLADVLAMNTEVDNADKNIFAVRRPGKSCT